jgi:hypothetical protein
MYLEQEEGSGATYRGPYQIPRGRCNPGGLFHVTLVMITCLEISSANTLHFLDGSQYLFKKNTLRRQEKLGTH